MMPDFVKYPIAAAVLTIMMIAVFVFKRAQDHQYQKGYNAATAHISQQIAQKMRKQQAKTAHIAKTTESKRQKLAQNERIQYVQVQKIIEKPVYREHCFDDDGLRELKQAIHGHQR